MWVGCTPSVQITPGWAFRHEPETCSQQARPRNVTWPVPDDRINRLMLSFSWQQQQITPKVVVKLLHQAIT